MARPSPWYVFPSIYRLRPLTVSYAASPISRVQTRNPFPRHAAHDITLSPIRSSPTMASTPTSPAGVPLPAASPDETVEVF